MENRLPRWVGLAGGKDPAGRRTQTLFPMELATNPLAPIRVALGIVRATRRRRGLGLTVHVDGLAMVLGRSFRELPLPHRIQDSVSKLPSHNRTRLRTRLLYQIGIFQNCLHCEMFSLSRVP